MSPDTASSSLSGSSQRGFSLALIGLGLLGIGCGAAPLDTTARASWSTPGYGWPGGAPGSTPPKEHLGERPSGLVRQSAAPLAKTNFHEDTAPGAPLGTKTPAPTAALELPASACLEELGETGVHFKALEELRGVETPVEIRGPIGAVTYWANGGGALRLDCRLALTLHQLSSVFESHGIDRVRYSGAYVYRTTRSGRLSHHAHGLALDIHEVSQGGQKHDVKTDFGRNLECKTDAPLLNRLACSLRDSRMFEELLTPDSNADHHDHLHVAVPRSVQIVTPTSQK